MRPYAPDRGLFLDQTHRLHPDICAFTSELFYESRLPAVPNLDRQVLDGPTPFAGAGFWFVRSDHEGNQSSSPEEVERVAQLVDRLLQGRALDEPGERPRPLKLNDILIIAPYNAQVAALAARLPAGARIGTVDKFQGQEAPVVICSLTTSSPEDAPRGMDFLYSLNRLNVAVSRAKTACILVGNPRLFEPECRTPASDAPRQRFLPLFGDGAKDRVTVHVLPNLRDGSSREIRQPWRITFLAHGAAGRVRRRPNCHGPAWSPPPPPRDHPPRMPAPDPASPRSPRASARSPTRQAANRIRRPPSPRKKLAAVADNRRTG